MRRLLALACLGVLGLGACSAEGERLAKGDAATPTGASTSAPDRSQDLTAMKVEVMAVLDAMLKEDVTAFTSRIADGDSDVTTRGAVVDNDWMAVTRTVAPQGERWERAVSVNDARWMQHAGWPAEIADCWLAVEPNRPPYDVVALMTYRTGYIDVLADLTLTGLPEDGETSPLRGSIRLRSAMELMLSSLVPPLSYDHTHMELPIPVTFRIKNDRIAKLEFAGKDVADALANAGFRLADTAEEKLRSFSNVITYPEPPGKLPKIKAPADGKVMESVTEGCARVGV